MEKSNQSVIQQKLKSPKTLVFISVVCALLVDVFCLCAMFVGGMFDLSSLLLIVLVAMDLALLFVAIQSNFRFAYSLIFPAVYSVAQLFFTYLIAFQIHANTITLWALVVFVAVHFLGFLSLLTTIINSSKGVGSKKFFAILVLSICLIATGFSVTYVANDGIFGQGAMDQRAFVYQYDVATDSYAVVDIVDGFGTKATVPNLYKNQPVTSVSALALQDLQELTLNTDTVVEFTDLDVANLDNSLKIYTSSKNVDILKQGLITKSRPQGETFQRNSLILSNAVTPNDVEEGNVFITFNYDSFGLEVANYQLIPTWYGKAGDLFDIVAYAQEKSIDYVGSFDSASEQYLFDGYQNKGAVLSEVVANGNSVHNAKVDQSVQGAFVNFEKVYKVKVEDDNDTMYEDEVFKSFNDTGYRYVVQSNTTNLLGDISLRQGFDLEWQYSVGSSSYKYPLDDLAEVLSSRDESLSSNSILKIYPIWKLQSPTINSITTDKTSYVYGDDANVVATATPIIEGYNLDYLWSTATEDNACASSNYQLARVTPSMSGIYTVTVTASNPAVTSLTATASKEIVVNVGKRPVEFDWILPNSTYNGQERVIYQDIDVQPKVGDIIDDEKIYNCGVNNFDTNAVIKDVGVYQLQVALINQWSELYEIVGEQSKQFVITPFELTNVTWVNLSFVYNGLAQYPTITSQNSFGDDVVEYSYSNYGATATSHTVTASSNNPNYNLANDVNFRDYVISPAPLYVTWDNNSFVYNGNEQAPTVTISGLQNGESKSVLGLSVSGAKDVGSHTATASIVNTNYQIATNDSVSFEITPAPLNVDWTNQSLTYNGAPQKPTATAMGVGNDGSIAVTVSGEQTNVGSYTATASVLNTNYEIATNDSVSFEITPAPLNVDWSNLSLTYNGAMQKPTATAMGVGNDGSIAVTVSGEQTNVGSYTATATIQNGNYTLTNPTVNFEIKAKTISISWSNTTVTYNGVEQKPTATPNGVVDGDDLGLVVGGATNAGTHQITATHTNANYVIDETQTVTFVIEKANVQIIWGETSFIYDGNAHQPTAQATIGDQVVEDLLVDVTVTESEHVAVGTYQATATINNSNYQIEGSNQTTFTIQADQTEENDQ